MSRVSLRSVPWIGGLFIAGILAFGTYDMMRSYDEAIAATGRELNVQARVIAEQTARSLQAVDVVLRHLSAQYARGELRKLKEPELHALLKDQAVGFAQVDGFVLIGADGRLRAASYIEPGKAGAVSVSAIEAFRFLSANRYEGLYIDGARRSDYDGGWLYPISRRLETPGGQFAGVVAARGRIDYFQDFYRDVDFGPGTRTALVHRNGTLIARHPPAPDAIGKPLAGAARLATLGEGNELPLRTKSPIDGADRIGVARRVPGYPLTVVVTRDSDAVLAPWRTQAMNSAARGLGMAALATLLLWLLTRQLSRLDQTRHTLESERERFALAVAGSDDGIWVYDFVARRVFASARAREISAMPPGPETQSIDDWFAQVPIHPEDAPKRKAAMEEHLAGRTPTYEGEFRMLLPAGGYRWIRIHGLCVRDPSGKPLLMAGSTSDIDVRKRAEEALRASEEQYRAMFQGTTDELILRDGAGRIVDVNPAFLETNGLSREQVMADPARVFAPPELHERIRALYARARAGETVQYEAEVERVNRRRAWLEVRIVPVQVRGEPHSLSLARDITAQKLAEAALRSSEEQYRAIFNAAADALVLRDAQARIVDVNPAFLQISGYTRDEVLGQSKLIFAVPEMAEMGREMHRRVIAGESVRFEIQARCKDGTPRDIEMRAVPIRYRGEPHALGMARDITAQKHAEAERARLEGQLLRAKKLEAIGTLAGGIAHDFNNILAAILGYGEMAQKAAAEGSPSRRHLDAVMAAGQRAKSLVARILAFSRSGVGERVPVRVQAVVNEALDLVEASLPAGVRLWRRVNAPDAAVMADPTQIHQVVMNLCANAVQAIKAPGRITVSLDVREKRGGTAATSTLHAGRYVRLRVRDTGSGMPAAVLERAFDPFFTTKEVGVGTGLGLSLVHGIITDLGGGIDVESTPGEGTALTVYLPWSQAGAAPAKAEDVVPQGNGEAVLLIDDEEALVRLGEEMIAALGYEPVGFSSSAAALEAFRAEPRRFSAVLSDESMPEMTGSELAREIRRIRADIPIVLMSGFVSPALSARAREAGVAEVLAKPLVSRDIARSLAGALRA